MASKKMSGALLVVVFALAGLSHGEKCSTNEEDIVSKIIRCVTKNHPEYFLTVLTRMKDPAQMGDPDFMCNNEQMMSGLVKCALQYVEGCMPPAVESQMAPLMPSSQTIQRGVQFLCNNRKAFDHPCVSSKLTQLTMCFTNKLQSFSTVHHRQSSNMKEALCSALGVEEQCLTNNLAACPNTVVTSLKEGLMSFFPAELCNIRVTDSSNKLLFKPEVHVH